MECDQKLAIAAIVTALRRSGAIDRRTVEAIVETLEATAALAAPHCESSAAGLHDLAALIAKGPLKSCHAFAPQDAFPATLEARPLAN